MSQSQLLSGVTVVDLGVGMAPAIVARFLCDAGARVYRVEPEEGDPFADYYPAYSVWRSGEEFSVAADLEQLLTGADICIIGGEDHPALERRRDAPVIAEQFPELIVLDFTEGPSGEGYNGPSTELLAQVRSGLALEQLPDRPIVNAFEPANYGAALQGLIGVLGALCERESGGKGQVVTTSLFEGALVWISSYWAQLEKPNPRADFVIPRGVWPLVFKTKDDVHVHIVIGGAGSKYGIYQALDIDDPTVKPEDSGMPQPGAGPKKFFGDYDLLAKHAAKKNSGELLESIWEKGLPAEPVRQPGECWDDQQIKRNEVILTEDDGTQRVGIPFLANFFAGGTHKKTRSKNSLPLDGVRVIDCGAFVAGPFAGSALSDLGAEVIKIEALAGDPNRSIFKSFSAANRGKKAISIDMKSEEGRDIVAKLCASADVVMNNFRPGVSKRLGVDPETLSKSNPGIIVLEAPAYGSEGPLALKAGFDMVMQAWCGHEAKAAGRGNEPRWNRTNLVDIAGGMIGSVAILSALYHRSRTGNGAALESPLCNAGIFTLSELYKNKGGSVQGAPVLSSSLSNYHPAESLYEASDGWVAIVARGNEQALALRDALGLTEKIGNNVSQWSENEEREIASVVSRKKIEDLRAELNPQKIWVEPCIDDREKKILNDQSLIENRTVRVSTHKDLGAIHELGTMFSLSRFRLGNGLPAPAPGEHTRDILESLGYSGEKIDAFYDGKIVI